MQTRRTAARLALVVGFAVSALACDQYAMLKAKREFKNANGLYQAQEYGRAAAAYEETIRDEAALDVDPALKVAYFYLANSYDNLYRPGRQGEPENDALLERAVENYQLAAERAVDPNIKRLALQYLVAAYGPDKLNDPGQAEPIVRRMIELDPEDSTNYFALANLYENAGQYDAAEEILLQAKDIRPDDPAVYLQLAGYYDRQDDFPRTIEALMQRAEKEPSNPEAFYMLSTYYWEKAFRDFRLSDDEKRDYVMKGLEATDQALELKSDYMEAMVYKNILLRLQANLETDPDVQKALIAEADKLRDDAAELQQQRTAGVGD